MSYLTNPYRYVVAGCSSFPDSLNTSANGAVTGAEINTDDQKLGDGCVFFDGSNDLIDLDGIGGNSAFSTNVGSITAWINSANDGQSRTVLNWASPIATVYLSIRTDGTSLAVGLYSGGAWQWEALKSGLTQDEWHWLALVQDGVEVKYYFDNVEQTVFAIDTDRAAWVTSAMTNCRAGCRKIGAAANSDFFHGLVDDIGIWDVAITESIREHLWNSGDGNTVSSLTSSCDNIKAYYNCDELDPNLLNNALPI